MELVNLLKARAASPSKELRRDERFERLKAALSRLKPDYRKVIFLARVRELPMRDVASRMGRSLNATSVLLYRALMKLQEAFGATESLNLPDRRLEYEEESDGE